MEKEELTLILVTIFYGKQSSDKMPFHHRLKLVKNKLVKKMLPNKENKRTRRKKTKHYKISQIAAKNIARIKEEEKAKGR